MEPSPAPWISALRHSHDLLQSVVEPLNLDQVEQRSYASEWSIAQVLSHLGSQSEIFGLFLDAGLSGQDPPGADAFGPIWDIWNAKDPQAQASDALRADTATLERFESLDAEEQARLHLHMFGMELGTTGLARMRLGEHAIHTWDVAVALDPAAQVAPDAVALLIGTLDQLAGRSAKPDGKQRKIRVLTSDPERQFTLETGDAVTLTASDHEATPELGLSELRIPAEAFVRLIYGRLDPDHTPVVESTGVDLDELRKVFPGY
ncbi:MAG: maleylpyruvate isomerase family mycothiol-dependent enzyme [Actinomycetota bacterium]|nr:maleylpyruvate isomerase family mycothiol-dependent enzyme [Actinomycetota bacterium]